MNTCSIGIELKLDCHKNTYCSQSEISEILNEDKYLLTLRTGIKKYSSAYNLHSPQVTIY